MSWESARLVLSKEDKYAMFRLRKADEAYLLNPDKGPVDAYLDIDTIIRIAREHQVDAIHPGYGFLSENPYFAEARRKERHCVYRTNGWT